MEAMAAATYLDPTQGCDVELMSTGGKAYGAHWLALRSRLEYFNNMWTSGMKEKNDRKVDVKASGEAIRFVLDWVYGFDPNEKQNLEVLIETIQLAHLWNSDELGRAAHDATKFVNLSGMSLCELLGWSLSCGLFDSAVSYTERLKQINPIPRLLSAAELLRYLRKNDVPETGLWGVRLICLAIGMRSSAIDALLDTTMDYSENIPKAPKRPGFDMAMNRDLCLMASDGSIHTTFRQFLPKGFNANRDGSPREQDPEQPMMMKVTVDGEKEAVEMLVKVLNGEELESLSLEEYKNLYLLAYKMGLQKIMRLMHVKVRKLFWGAAEIVELLRWSCGTPLGVAILARLHGDVRDRQFHYHHPDDSGPSPTMAGAMTVRLLLALLMEANSTDWEEPMDFKWIVRGIGRFRFHDCEEETDI